MLCRNAQIYNEEDSLIVEHARILTGTLWKFIKYAQLQLATTLVVWELDSVSVVSPPGPHTPHA